MILPRISSTNASSIPGQRHLKFYRSKLKMRISGRVSGESFKGKFQGKVSRESFKGRFDSCESNLPLYHIQIFSFIDMHHTYLILISSKSVHTVHISDQGLQPLVRYAHNQL